MGRKLRIIFGKWDLDPANSGVTRVTAQAARRAFKGYPAHGDPLERELVASGHTRAAFVLAMFRQKITGRRLEDIHDRLRRSCFWACGIAAAVFLLAMVVGLAERKYGHFPVGGLALLMWSIIMMASTLSNGFRAYQVRTINLASVREFLGEPAQWIPPRGWRCPSELNRHSVAALLSEAGLEAIAEDVARDGLPDRNDGGAAALEQEEKAARALAAAGSISRAGDTGDRDQ